MLQTHKYHINTAITETCIKQPFTISYMLEFISMLKASKMSLSWLMLRTHKYHINTPITETCIKQPFTISYMLEFISMLKASNKLTVARYLRSMTTQDRNVVETKQSYSCIHFHRKMHRLLKTLWSNSNAEMNALAIIQRLAAGLIMPFVLSS
ncbi:hypothetical protein T03_18054 [Trichinella britovi]|uniref:Uncharacterized protein n=1 Tax=Trichinella britovi TaxID=45882 RepID=A0A0V1CWA4_TRIBR|nr:hypothetical protein T03_18054 [Trichinella britovi]